MPNPSKQTNLQTSDNPMQIVSNEYDIYNENNMKPSWRHTVPTPDGLVQLPPTLISNPGSSQFVRSQDSVLPLTRNNPFQDERSIPPLQACFFTPIPAVGPECFQSSHLAPISNRVVLSQRAVSSLIWSNITFDEKRKAVTTPQPCFFDKPTPPSKPDVIEPRISPEPHPTVFSVKIPR